MRSNSVCDCETSTYYDTVAVAERLASPAHHVHSASSSSSLSSPSAASALQRGGRDAPPSGAAGYAMATWLKTRTASLVARCLT
jgi:hypothetical protein